MRSVLTSSAALLSAALLAAAAPAADVKPAAAPAGPEVHRMLILNGPTASVHYFSAGLSPGDQAYLRDLERTENDAAYADDLAALRRTYVADELVNAPQRAVAQQGLYGKSITRDYEGYSTAAGWPGYGYGAYPYAYPYFTGYGGYGGVAGAAFSGSSSTINQSLAFGVGDEGALKTAMAPVIAGQANAEFAAAAGRAYTTALNHAASSEGLRTALNLNKGGVAAAGNEPARKVTLMLKGGDKVEGVITDEDADWITVDNGTDEVSVRKADVGRIDRHKK